MITRIKIYKYLNIIACKLSLRAKIIYRLMEHDSTEQQIWGVILGGTLWGR